MHTGSPQLDMFHLGFSDLQWYKSDCYSFSRDHALDFQCSSSPRLAICRIFPHDAGPWQPASGPRQPHDLEGLQPILWQYIVLLAFLWILRFVFWHSILSTKHPFVSPASGEKKEAISLEMTYLELKLRLINCPTVG